jgi:hypothetical protein
MDTPPRARSRKYYVYYKFIPFQSGPMFDPRKPDEHVESPLPHTLYAYTAEDAVTQANLIFLHGNPGYNITPYDDLGREYIIVRVEPANE